MNGSLAASVWPWDDVWVLTIPVKAGDTVYLHGKSRLVLQVSGDGPYVAAVDYPLSEPAVIGATVRVRCGTHPIGLRKDDGQCLECLASAPSAIRFVEVPCPGTTCVHYLYGMQHKHEFEV